MSDRLFTSLPPSPLPTVKSGHILFGNDFTEDQLQRWYRQEEEAYFESDAGSGDVDEWYTYMRFVNEKLGFGCIESLRAKINQVLVLGPGSGKEMEEFNDRNPKCSIIFLEASKNFQRILLEKYPNSRILQPDSSGQVGLYDNTVDLVTAFSVLHHIPNVGKVVMEAGRVLRSGGYFFVREPCSSMGDWGAARSATPNERGISKKLMLEFALAAGFELAMAPTPILFEPINRIIKKTIGFKTVNFSLLYFLDKLISKCIAINDHYWRDNLLKKIGPSSYFYVFKKK